jgi:L-rhamnose mutarotase
LSGRTLLFALDLVDDPQLIAEYENHHRPGGVWDEILRDIRAQGVLDMEIWRTGNRLVMMASVDDDYPRDRQGEPKVEAWEELMWKYQQALPDAKPGEKWVPLTKIFDLGEHEQRR